MKIENSFLVPAPRDRVWRFIQSAEEVGACVPGCEHVDVVGEGKFKARVRVKVGPIKALFNIDIERTEEEPMESASYSTRGEEGGRASRLSARSRLTLRAAGEKETEVAYASEISIAGRLGRFGAGVMKKKADDLGGQFAEALRQRIADTPA
ncbi:MAG: SRPBCC domain-containing protein [Gammaproteobacteria bacterium]|nr:SRPBCC domain-containing protein [Gammaproteobacteria bacterium]MDE0366446.1 SRPBCC domain-containing protein [Gammaproteobacteria bacterium]